MRLDGVTDADAQTSGSRNFAGVFSQPGATPFINRRSELKVGALRYCPHYRSTHPSADTAHYESESHEALVSYAKSSMRNYCLIPLKNLPFPSFSKSGGLRVIENFLFSFRTFPFEKEDRGGFESNFCCHRL